MIKFVKRKWPTWFVPNWDSIPSTVFENGHAITAALLINTSIFSTLALMLAAASRTEARLLRSRLMNLVLTAGLIALMRSMTGWILPNERPARTINVGDPAARHVAVSAPIPRSLGPVITTECLLAQMSSHGMLFTCMFCPLPHL